MPEQKSGAISTNKGNPTTEQLQVPSGASGCEFLRNRSNPEISSLLTPHTTSDTGALPYSRVEIKTLPFKSMVEVKGEFVDPSIMAPLTRAEAST